MATFPELNRRNTDDRQPDTGLISVYGPDGSQFGQSLYSDEYWIFTPQFTGLTLTDRLQLESFYKSNKLLAFTYNYRDVNAGLEIYECYFVSPGYKIVPLQTPPGQEVYVAQAWFRGRLAP